MHAGTRALAVDGAGPPRVRLVTMALLRSTQRFAGSLLLLSACGSSPAGTTVALGTPGPGEPGVTGERGGDRGPATIACGKASCSAPQQVCCAGDAPKCTTAPPPDPEPLKYLSAVGEACGAEDGSFAGFAGCDDSGDCPAGQRCCEQWVASGQNGYLACSASCDIREVCVEGRPCSKSGAACVDGTCAMPPEKRHCGAATCTREKPFCCGADEASAVCSTSAQCEDDGKRRFECASPRDCIEGACQRNVMGNTYCTLLVDVANAGLVCERDADCDDSICMGSPGKGRCDVAEKACVCDAP